MNDHLKQLVAAENGKHTSWFHLFKHFDTDGTGRIDEKELEKALRGQLKLTQSEMSSEQYRHLWDFIETGGDGHVEVQEFCEFMRTMQHEQRLRAPRMQEPPTKENDPFYAEVPAPRAFSDYEWDESFPGTLKPGLAKDNYDMDDVMQAWEGKEFEAVLDTTLAPRLLPQPELLLCLLAAPWVLLTRPMLPATSSPFAHALHPPPPLTSPQASHGHE